MWKYFIYLYRLLIPVTWRDQVKIIQRTLPSWIKKSKQLQMRDLERYYQSVLDQSSPLPALKKPDLALAGLMDTFRKMQVRGELLGNAWWTDFLHAITLNNAEGSELQLRLQQGLANHSDTALQYWEWLHLTKIALKFGLFDLAYWLRLKARNSAISTLKKQDLNPAHPGFRTLLAAAAEAGEWDLFRANLNRLGFVAKNEKNAFLFLQRLALKRLPNAHRNLPIFKVHADNRFAEFTKNKRIAFVGPSKSLSKDAAEIDGYDLVVRCNYKEAGIGTDSDIKGLRCDISYFNNTQTRSICESKPLQVPEVIKFAVFRAQTSLQKFRKAFLQLDTCFAGQLITRLSENYSLMLFEGSLNAIPNALCDLLRFDTDSIKIFHADLMLTVDRFTGYTPGVENSAKHIDVFLKSCAGAHDPLTQYALLKLMHSAKKISGDPAFERVMQLGEASYMKELQQIYGNFARVGPFSGSCYQLITKSC